MNVGDLLRWSLTGSRAHPLAIVIMVADCDQNGQAEHSHRIRVMWLGDDVPYQAFAFSINKHSKRISTWMSPDYFEVFSETR